MAAQHRKSTPTRPRSTARSGNPQRRSAGSADPHPAAGAGVGGWIGAARLRTLPLSITPVLIGTGAARLVDPDLHWVLALGCLAVGVLLQIGVNFANDYSDGIRGTDRFRQGPARLTGAGRARPRTVLVVALIFFALAAAVGLALVVRTGHWWILAVGAACIVAAWFYTGGRRPYGYHGLGEVFVFVFFGLVATAGSTYIQVGAVPQEAWLGAVAAGSLATAVLLINNLRDLEPDRAAGKRTLSVIIGRRWSQVLFTVLLAVPVAVGVFLAVFYPIAWLTLMTLLGFGPAVLIAWTYRRPPELVVALTVTSLTALAYGAVLLWAFSG